MSVAVLVHGFGQTRQCWGQLPSALDANNFSVRSIDAPGHGDNSSLALNLVETGDWLADVGGPATYIGYSMGARMCLHTALLRPDVVERLVLISGTGGIDDPTERTARVAADNDLADRIELVGTAKFVDEWLTLPMFAHLPVSAQMREERLRNGSAGLATSLRLAGTGTQEPMWSALRRLQMPVLVIAGALDKKFCDLAQRIAVCIGANATVSIIEDSGHTVHLEQPAAFESHLSAWLRC